MWPHKSFPPSSLFFFYVNYSISISNEHSKIKCTLGFYFPVTPSAQVCDYPDLIFNLAGKDTFLALVDFMDVCQGICEIIFSASFAGRKLITKSVSESLRSRACLILFQ